jgi:catechol 2,3-dioxygenase-like lactoylglutathione lyase family enzyme
MLDRNDNHYWGVVLDAPNAHELAEFYSRLLGWKIASSEPNWVTLGPPSGVAYLACQTSPEYVRPVWPPAPGQQQMMLHLDIEVGRLNAAVAQAIEDGATLAEHQPQERVRVMLDPAGHPFCLYLDDTGEL